MVQVCRKSCLALKRFSSIGNTQLTTALGEHLCSPRAGHLIERLVVLQLGLKIPRRGIDHSCRLEAVGLHSRERTGLEIVHRLRPCTLGGRKYIWPRLKFSRRSHSNFRTLDAPPPPQNHRPVDRLTPISRHSAPSASSCSNEVPVDISCS